MSFITSKGISIVGMATAVPRGITTVDSYIEAFGQEAVERFKGKTGIKEMHRTLSEQTASDLGYVAAVKLLAQLEIHKEEIGLLIFVSQAPDYRKPATACVLQHRLGLGLDCAVLDIGLGCSGFVYGDRVIRNMLSTLEAKYALLIVAETSSKQLGANDKTIGMMFGDAGAAILYEKGTEESSGTLLKSDGSRYKSIIVPAGGFREMYPEVPTYVDSDGKEHSKFETYMDGMGVFAFSIMDVPKAIKEYLKLQGKVAKDYDYLLMHQANQMIIQQIASRLKMPIERVPISLDRYGNTSSVTIPLTICNAFGGKEQGKLSILAAGFGIGLSLGITSFELDTAKVLPIIESDDYYLEGKL